MPVRVVLLIRMYREEISRGTKNQKLQPKSLKFDLGFVLPILESYLFHSISYCYYLLYTEKTNTSVIEIVNRLRKKGLSGKLESYSLCYQPNVSIIYR